MSDTNLTKTDPANWGKEALTIVGLLGLLMLLGGGPIAPVVASDSRSANQIECSLRLVECDRLMEVRF